MQTHRQKLVLVTQKTWEGIEKRARGRVMRDVGTHLGHEESEIDVIAAEEFEQAVRRYYPEFQGTIVFEDTVVQIGTQPVYMLVDQIDGTTNSKRALNAPIRVPINAAISVALSTSRQLGDIFASAVLLLNTGQVLSSVKVGEEYKVYVDDVQQDPARFRPNHGDTQLRPLVIRYSSKVREFYHLAERALIEAGIKRPYEGCRSSTVDIVNVLGWLYDAYVDLRALFGDEECYGAMLQGYDVAGVLPVALGLGLEVQALGKPWQEHDVHERIALVVAWPEIMGRIMAAIEPLDSLEKICTVMPQFSAKTG